MAPNKHNPEATRPASELKTDPPAGTKEANAELPINPKMPPRTPNPEPTKVKMHKTVKNPGLFATSLDDVFSSLIFIKLLKLTLF